jgi:hypothetical protein
MQRRHPLAVLPDFEALACLMITRGTMLVAAVNDIAGSTMEVQND